MYEAAAETQADLGAVDRVRELFRGLFDLRFKRLITLRMLPTIYLLTIAASGYAVLALPGRWLRTLGDTQPQSRD